MRKAILVIAILVFAVMFSSCARMENARYDSTDKIIASAPCIISIEEIEEIPAAKVIKIREPIMFPFDSDEIPDDEWEKIHSIAGVLIENSDIMIVINGFASSEDYNMDLSGRRAEAVKDALIYKGIEENRIETAAKGETGLFGELLNLNRRAIVLDVE